MFDLDRKKNSAMTVRIRPTVVADAATIHRCISELAAVQGIADQVLSTVEDVVRDGFGSGARFRSILAERDGEAVGLASYFFTYSTWQGRPTLYVEDLIVNDTSRGLGVGTALMRELARLALEHACSRLELSVSAKNTARAFYEGLGMSRKADWLPYSIAGAALDSLAARPS